MASLKARGRQAGTRQRCPRCQFMLVVPTAAEAAARAAKARQAGEYSLHDPASDLLPAPARQAYIPVICGLCHTRMDATPEMVGQRIVCPDCDTPTVVPPLAEPAAEDQPLVIDPGGEDVYAVCEGVDQPTADYRAVYQQYIAVICPLCGTRMHAAEDRVGETIVCPDCQTPTVVPPLARTPSRKRPLTETQEYDPYDLCEGVDQPAPASLPAHQTYIAAICPLCHTRLNATEDQVGRELVCPDCGQPVPVRAPAARAPKSAPQLDPDDVYGVAAPAAAREAYRRVEDYRPLKAQPDEEAPAEDLLRRSDSTPAVRAPPRWAFFSGVFSFPFYADVWPRWLLLSLGATVGLSCVALALSISSGPVAGLENAPAFVGGMMLFGIAVMVWLVCVVPMSAACVAIIEDTSEGNDAIQSWPDPMFVDWMFDSFFFVNSLVVSMLAGLAAVKLFDAAGLPGGHTLTITVLVLFPILLLSTLEGGSAWKLFSPPIWRSLLRAWWAWAFFYLETTALLAAAGWLTGVMMRAAGLFGAAVAAVFLVAAALIYCRLLGRLAWVCRGRPVDEDHESCPPPDQAEPPPAA